MKNLDRKRVGFIGSLGFHAVVFLVIAFTGLLHTQKLPDNIMEIAIIGGGGGGGEVVAEAAASEEISSEEAEEIPPEEVVEPDAILEQNKQAPEKRVVQQKTSAPKAAFGSTGTGTGTGSGGGSGGGHGTGSGKGVGAGSGEITSNPAVPPRVVRSVSPVYPEAQRRANITGTAYLRLLIGADGNVENVTLLQSSGNGALDASALRAAGKWRFVSAKNHAGQKIRCYLDVPIRFYLRR